jgi:hypothetical protein
MRCRTTYAVGLQSCPHCGGGEYSEGGVVAKASAEGGSTLYVAEGQPVPDDVPPGVRLVGPGAPADAADAAELEPAPEVVPDPVPDLTPPGNSGESSDPADGDDGPADYAAYRIVDLRDLCRDRDLSPTGSKGELAERLAAYDQEHAAL